MRMLVQSLKRLYEAKRVTKAQIEERVKKGTITEEEFYEITGETYK